MANCAKNWLLTILICSWTLETEGREIRWTHFGLRPLAMGNAFVSVADDFNALFYNPAGLARLQTWDGELLNPTLEIAEDTLNFINDLSKFVGGNSSSVSDSLQLVLPQIGKFHHFAVYLTPHLVFKGWGFGIGWENSFNLVPHGDIDFEVEAGTQLIAPISYAFDIVEDRVSLGLSVKPIAIAKIDDSINLGSLSAFSQDSEDAQGRKLDDMVRAGFGIGVDLGMLFTPEAKSRPSIGISITDTGGTRFKKQGSTTVGTPRPRYPSVNTGISFTPYSTKNSYVLVAFDSHFINQPFHFSHKLNTGIEWGISSLLKLQSGLKEGYLTAGFQFDVGLLNLRFATYSVDHGPVVGSHPDLVERRYALQLKLLI